MSKTIRIIPSLLMAAFLLHGCSSTPKEDQTSAGINKNSRDTEAYSDSSAPLPVDSSDISAELPGKIPDSLRHKQTRVPVDRQIKDDQTESKLPEPPAAKETVKEVKLSGNFAVQLGAFSTDKNASEFAFTVGKKLGGIPTVKFNPANGLFVVWYGEFMSRSEAEKAAKDLKKKNFKDVFIVTTKE